MTGTPERLLEATLTVLRTQGLDGVSARTIAAAADANQALVFYHFGSVNALIDQACRAATAAMISEYAAPLAEVGSVAELIAVGRMLHRQESARGTVNVLGQLLAGGQHDDALAGTSRACLQLWTTVIHEVLARVLADSPIRDLLDPRSLAVTVSAAFIGIELFEGVDPQGGRAALDTLQELADLIAVLDELGPVARRAVAARIRRHERAKAGPPRSSVQP